MAVRGYPVKPLSRGKIRLMAGKIRSLIDLNTEPYFPIVDFTEFFLPTLYDDFQFEVISQKEMGEQHGETFPNRHLIRIREDVYDGACEGMGRDRFTIAHEVGHLLLHTDVVLSRIKLNRIITHEIYEDSEWQADTFAGELLIPVHLVKGKNVREIVKECKVSSRAANVMKSVAKR